LSTISEQAAVVVRAAIRWTCGLTAIACVLALLLADDFALVWSIALGALITLVNFVLLTVTLGRSMSAPDLVDDDGTPTRRIRFGVALRWPVFLVALVFILWYMPARPLALAIGLVIGLAAAALAALAAKNRRSPSDPPTS
jgi:hypothetical protein